MDLLKLKVSQMCQYLTSRKHIDGTVEGSELALLLGLTSTMPLADHIGGCSVVSELHSAADSTCFDQ